MDGLDSKEIPQELKEADRGRQGLNQLPQSQQGPLEIVLPLLITAGVPVPDMTLLHQFWIWMNSDIHPADAHLERSEVLSALCLSLTPDAL